VLGDRSRCVACAVSRIRIRYRNQTFDGRNSYGRHAPHGLRHVRKRDRHASLGVFAGQGQLRNLHLFGRHAVDCVARLGTCRPYLARSRQPTGDADAHPHHASQLQRHQRGEPGWPFRSDQTSHRKERRNCRCEMITPETTPPSIPTNRRTAPTDICRRVPA
jgi:hypothetical protein